MNSNVEVLFKCSWFFNYLHLYRNSSMRSILTQIEKYYEFKTPVIWKYVLLVSWIQLCALYGIYLIPNAKPLTTIWAIFGALVGSLAVSTGPHRLWAHKTYKAKLPMRIILMLSYMLAGQYSIVSWVRDHRTHHKYTETDADPHSAARGFFYSHCGWHMMKRHPEYKEKRNVIDLSDLWEDPVICFHQKYFHLLSLTLHIIFPSAFASFVIGDTLQNSIIIAFFLRYAFSLNVLWCVNSVAHFWGYRPYNKNINATQNAVVSFAFIGEGWHNYHHTFPWDYRNGEAKNRFRWPAYIIEACVWLGQAYDLKTASPELVQKVLAKQQNLPKNYEVPETGFTEKFDTIATEIKAM